MLSKDYTTIPTTVVAAELEQRAAPGIKKFIGLYDELER